MEDSREPVELLSRVLAHLFHRIPGLRRVERRLEGADASSGILSDIFALIAQLYHRNKPAFKAAAAKASDIAAERKAAKEAEKAVESAAREAADAAANGAPKIVDEQVIIVPEQPNHEGA